MGRLAGKVALITGGARGVGRGISERFAAEGAKVVIAGRTESDGKDAVGYIRSGGGDAIFVRTDISVEDDAAAAVAAAVEHYGSLTSLVNNAAAMELGAADGPIADVTLEGWNSVLGVNLTGTFLMTKHAVREMVRADQGGTIVNISSVGSKHGMPAISAYTAAKGAINSLSRAIAVDYARARIRCNTLLLGLHPGDRFTFFLTDPDIRGAMEAVHLTPRFGVPDDVAHACAYFSSAESGFITGAELTIDGGVHSASRYPDVAVLSAYSEYEDE